MATASTPEIADFLRRHSPFDALADRQLARVAAAAEVEDHPAGATIFAAGEAPVADLRVIGAGAVELVAAGRVLDLLTGGDVFGHGSMLSGLPPGFEARAAEPTRCYRIPASLAQEVLGAPAGLQFVTRSLLEAPTDLHALAREPARNAADQPVATLLRGPPVVCLPETSVGEATRRLTDGGCSAAVVTLPDGTLGIVTDHDLRVRVLAAGRGPETPVAEVMSAPAHTCDADQPAGAALLEMLDRGIRHLPVRAATGELLGVLEDMDVVAARTRSSFYLRQRIAAAGSITEVVTVARELGPMVISLHESHVAAANVMAVYAVCVDALTRRLLELTLAAHDARAEFAWLALGSQARREALPSSDVDSAIVFFDGEGEDDEIRGRLVEVAREVLEGLATCGLRLDANGVNASAPGFVRSVGSWQQAARGWVEQPTQEKALILSSVVVDSRPVWGVHTGSPVSDTFRVAPDHPALLRLMARFAIARRPPTGFLRGLVVEHSGEHRGRLDLKQGGSVPIAAIARWAGMSAGVTGASTPERLRAAAAADALTGADAHTLHDAFELVSNLRLEHQVAQMRAGVAPDDHLDPMELSPLMRTALKEAFRAVSAIQRRIATEVEIGAR